MQTASTVLLLVCCSFHFPNTVFFVCFFSICDKECIFWGRHRNKINKQRETQKKRKNKWNFILFGVDNICEFIKCKYKRMHTIGHRITSHPTLKRNGMPFDDRLVMWSSDQKRFDCFDGLVKKDFYKNMFF